MRNTAKRSGKVLWPAAWLTLAAMLAMAWAIPTAAWSQETEPSQKKSAAKKTRAKKAETVKPATLLEWPPKLPGGVEVATDTSPDLLAKPESVALEEGVVIAKTAPTVDFAYFPGQTKYTKLWSDWGDGSTSGSKYYTGIGDHAAPRGIAQVYEYDTATKKIRLLMDVKEFMETSGALPPGMDYTPGKIHSRTDIGSDGWVYFSTHRGSTKGNTDDAHGYLGDWIFRVNPETGKQEIAAAYPMPKHTIPASVLDSQRLIYYGGTAQGNDATDKGVWFIAYDVKNNKLLKRAPGGFGRYAILASSNGCVYWQAGKARAAKGGGGEDEGEGGGAGRKYDPKTNEITDCPGVPNVRAATRETPDGVVYGFTQGNRNIWAFDVKTETHKFLGPAMVGRASYVASADVDPSGRYVYYVAGAHGDAGRDGAPVVQYDTKTNTRKVIAFLHDYCVQKYHYEPAGTFGTALSPDGSIIYVTWNGRRALDARDWDTCALTAIYIPESERQP